MQAALERHPAEERRETDITGLKAMKERMALLEDRLSRLETWKHRMEADGGCE